MYSCFVLNEAAKRLLFASRVGISLCLRCMDNATLILLLYRYRKYYSAEVIHWKSSALIGSYNKPLFRVLSIEVS